ncbi:unnamed protein product [Mytilus coruscus]|uniref:Uncharacterized protein n=1 Tax=Mytilus coruscus TaxID=42192 RepID=A0A6J8C862_MYTCO|nr:unnamed protein product [Mytilus coruscus]
MTDNDVIFCFVRQIGKVSLCPISISVATLYDKDQVNNSYSKASLDRECSKCGLSLLKFTDEELNVSDDAPNVSWERYAYITVNSKKKLTLVRYSGNYGCKEKFELQQTYFQRTKVSIHVSVIYRHAILEVDGIESLPDIPCIITERFFVISPDEKHDQFFTQKVQTHVKEYLDSIRYDVKVIHEFTDGCPVQYKSRNCFGMLTDICSKHGYELFIRNYFETSHAKGPQDAAGGFLKNQVDMAVFRGNEIIQSAADFFKYCGKHLKDTKSLYCKRRIFRYVESIDRDTISFKPVPGIRSLHQVFSSLDDANLTVRLFKADACPETLKKDTTDDWGVTYVKGSKVVRGLYFDQTKKLLSYKLLDKKHFNSIISIASVIYISPTLQCSTHGTLSLLETTHLDILLVLDEMEGAQ